MSANDFCRYIWKSYLEGRWYDLVSEFVSDKTSVIGTGTHEIERNLHELIAKFTEESYEWTGHSVIRDQQCQTTELSDFHSLVMGELAVREDSEEGILYDMCFRLTIVLEKSENRQKVAHIRQFVTDPDRMSDEFFPHHMVEKTHTQIVYNLRHDSLTGLLNHLYPKETCECLQVGGDDGAFLMMDIDWFKKINDQYGHPTGDKTLISFLESLKSVIPPVSLATRMGEDEFTLYSSDIRQKGEVEDSFLSLMTDWEERQKVLHIHDQVSINAGVAFTSNADTSYEVLLAQADQALYLVKKRENNELIHWEFSGSHVWMRCMQSVLKRMLCKSYKTLEKF